MPTVVPPVRRAAAASAARRASRWSPSSCRRHRGREPAHRPARRPAVAEGAVLAAYRFTPTRASPRPPASNGWWWSAPASTPATARRGGDGASPIGDAVRLARDLVNTPGSSDPERAWPRRPVEIAGAGAGGRGLGRGRIAAERLGGLLGVARGSAEPPRLIRIAYEPADPGRRTGAARGPRGQGHHLRLRRAVAQDRRRHG